MARSRAKQGGAHPVERRRTTIDSATERLNAVLGALQAAAAGLDRHGCITGWSPGARELLGWSEAQVLGRPLQDVVCAPDRLQAAVLLAGDQATGRLPRRALLSLCRADGPPLPVDVHLIPRAGRRGGYDAVFRPVAGGARGTAPAARAAETFRSVFDSASVGILVLSVDGIVLDGNGAAAALFGCGREALVGIPFESVADSAVPCALRDAIDGTLAGQSARLACRLRAADGRSPTVELTVSPGSYFGVPAVLLFAHDVTRLQSARAELGRARERLRALLQASPLPLLSLDAEGRVTSWNAVAEQVLGWTGAEVLGRPLPFLAADEAPEWLDRVRAGEAMRGTQALVARRDGVRLRVSLSTAPLRDAAGGPAGCVALLAEMAEPLQLDALERAQRLNALGALASRVAHDFNNILTVVEGDAELLGLNLRSQGTEPPEELLGIQEAAARAGELTRQLLAFGRGDKGGRQVVDLNQAVENLGRMLRRLVGDEVELVVSAGAAQPRVTAVPGELDQVLVNLVVNARDAMENGGKLTVEALNLPGRGGERSHGEPETWGAVRVCDTGSGMTPEVLQSIFEPFFTTKTDGRGTGLGLWTVDRVIRESGGHVRVRTGPGEGTEITVLLPLAHAADEADAPDSPDALPGGDAGPHALPDAPPSSDDAERAGDGTTDAVEAGETVLVAEDDPALRRVMRHALQRAGYRAVVTENGEACLRAWDDAGGRVALVVTDMGMPRMDGRELVGRLRVLDPAVPVLLVSGDGDSSAPPGDGGISLLHKPFGIGELVRAVQAALAAGRDGTAADTRPRGEAR